MVENDSKGREREIGRKRERERERKREIRERGSIMNAQLFLLQYQRKHK